MDEIAHGVGMDPLAFRLKNLADPRLKAVFEAAAEKFGWGKQKAAAGRGFGIAGGVEKGGYVATCAEVEIEGSSRQVRIRRVVAAFECGAVVNPDGLRNQVEGAIVQGIGGALFEAIAFENGRITNPHFAQYRVPRFTDVPRIETVILDRKDLPPAGAGATWLSPRPRRSSPRPASEWSPPMAPKGLERTPEPHGSRSAKAPARSPPGREARANSWGHGRGCRGHQVPGVPKPDDTQTGSVAVAIGKARCAALFKRPTKAFQDVLAGGGDGLRVLGLEGAVPVEGGVPLVRDGKIVGAIGLSGGASSQDGQCARAGAED
jgi:hypothetical protein